LACKNIIRKKIFDVIICLLRNFSATITVEEMLIFTKLRRKKGSNQALGAWRSNRKNKNEIDSQQAVMYTRNGY